MATWQGIARENLRMSRIAAGQVGGERTACSRAYYAAFSGLTAFLRGTVATFPNGQVTPTHRQVRRLVREYGDPAWQDEIEALILGLYTLRILADYRNDATIRKEDADQAVTSAWRILFRLGVG